MLSILAARYVPRPGGGSRKRMLVRAKCRHHSDVLCEEKGLSYGNWCFGGERWYVQPVMSRANEKEMLHVVDLPLSLLFLTDFRWSHISHYNSKTGTAGWVRLDYAYYCFHTTCCSDGSDARTKTTSDEEVVGLAAEDRPYSMERNPFYCLCSRNVSSIHRLIHSLLLYSGIRLICWQSE